MWDIEEELARLEAELKCQEVDDFLAFLRLKNLKLRTPVAIPKQPRQLPKALTMEEMWRLLESRSEQSQGDS